MSPRTYRIVTPLLVALLAALGVVAPVLGVADARSRDEVRAQAAARCCGDDCRCGTTCPCVARDRSSESTDAPLAPIELRAPRTLCLAAPATTGRVALVETLDGRLLPSTGGVVGRCRPAGRELLARVSKWTT